MIVSKETPDVLGIWEPKWFLVLNDLSIGSTETKYIKLNTKTQNIFCYVNENLTTFFIHFDRGDKKTEGEEKVFFFKVYTKVESYWKKFGF